MTKATKDVLENILQCLPDIRFGVTEVRVCVFLTAVVSRHCGLASTGVPSVHPHEKGIGAVGRLTEIDAFELAQYCLSDDLLEASIGLAALNSLVEIDEGLCTEANAFELILEKGKGKNITVVGHFPFIEKLKKEARQLWVLERNPQEDDLSEEKASEVLPASDVVAITGSTLVNHTFTDIVSLCPPTSFKILLGPSTPMCPALFDHGIDALAGVKVANPRAALRTISQAAHFRAVEGTKRLTMLKQ